MNESLKSKIKKGTISKEELIEIKKGVTSAERLATVLDDGMLDPLLGLVEGGGDAASALAGLYILKKAKESGMPYHKLAIMAGRQALDFGGGSIPIIGDVFDFAYKSNKKNAEMLKKHFAKIEKEAAIKKRAAIKKDVEKKQKAA